MWTLKIRKMNDELGVVLPREILDRLQVREADTVILVETHSGRFELTTAQAEFDEKLAKAREIIAGYPNTFRSLED